MRAVAGHVAVQRVNVLTREGAQLAGQLEVDRVPMVLLFDRTGLERYREYGLALRGRDLQRAVVQSEAGQHNGERG